ncbi:uncharacterized protein OCT59_002983 [Rhizophagus irregularis]|uniref:F-box domain-containing protein n=4 Tax=Rhizophagus irregularis TaxID=588596 RepID=U9SUK2_RHIID|nr:hypothetical protein GLOIN_2v1782082 [Rhizophagus irregularis DAOM 181602=DAOM 197198]EXX56185.1 hypothetical protein RirG_218510 [Rhizophagus irregularis DAOM 197198w]PKY47229.1 hypothetical protein RhiirA4_462355 [Rhizophagus irregularis]POG65126.1 hypothetical protein GLOIN_2v1782082 [Rhizophagus irregularis DAOM 181602=DAOM 197198]UZO11414.1 hypothetical protein OCT59_002983 [Rhizophagus irregularis]GBC36741.1 hypothetical protein GLOIN_2v1782082 [Rhizophagus irregularis DAOM 181602=DAO|eukprot:XP_025171992.1 hypothetical protein GLOIN_2v1782082 [Rhizophagus irregularis DAOM 181602=DAOM 197198]
MVELNVDCLILIFNELQTDKESLYACLLVNREWCHLVVPILWKKYSWYYDYEESEKKLFNIILSSLSSSSKQLLSDNDIKLPSTIFLKPLLFNYISYCKFLEVEIIDKIINMVFEEEIITENIYDKKNLLEQEIYKLFIVQCKNIKELSWQTLQPLSLFPGASICFSQLYSLSIDIDFVNSDALYEMTKICKDLNELTVYDCSQDHPGLISLIDVQRNLKRVSLYSYSKKGICKELSKALTRKGNTISDLGLYPVSIIQPSFLTSLINLRNMSIYNYHNDNIEKEILEFQKYLAISEFPKLQSLNVYGLSSFRELAILIEKTKGNILEIYIYIYNKAAENTEMLIKAIANNCSKIERLSTHLEPKDFIHVKSLLLNCKNLIHLEFNSLSFLLSENDNTGDELLDNLTEFAPKSLAEIIISGDWKYSIDALERFFESCRERNLNRFDITHYGRYYITDDHKVTIRKYINEGVIIESNCA